MGTIKRDRGPGIFQRLRFLRRRLKHVTKRDGGSYDKQEAIALQHVITVIERMKGCNCDHCYSVLMEAQDEATQLRRKKK